MRVKILRPTSLEDETVARAAEDGTPSGLEPMYGLCLIIREDATPLREQPNFEALERSVPLLEAWSKIAMDCCMTLSSSRMANALGRSG